ARRRPSGPVPRAADRGLFHLERRLRVLGQAAADWDRAARPAQRRRAPDEVLRRVRRRPGATLLLRGAQQDLDAHAVVVALRVRARPVCGREGASMGPDRRAIRGSAGAAQGRCTRPARRLVPEPPVERDVASRTRPRQRLGGATGTVRAVTGTPFSVLLPYYRNDDPAHLRRSFLSVTADQPRTPD